MSYQTQYKTDQEPLTPPVGAVTWWIGLDGAFYFKFSNGAITTLDALAAGAFVSGTTEAEPEIVTAVITPSETIQNEIRYVKGVTDGVVATLAVGTILNQRLWLVGVDDDFTIVMNHIEDVQSLSGDMTLRKDNIWKGYWTGVKWTEDNRREN